MRLNRKFKLAFVIAALAFVCGSVLGTLLIPVILALNCSFYWLFLYAGYALITLYVVLYCVKYWPNDTADRRNKNEDH